MEVDFNVAFSKIITDSAKIEKTKELPMEEYVHFCNNLLDEYDFLKEFEEQDTRDENGNIRCLLVLCQGADDGVLVYTEGNEYPKFTSHIPNARQMDIIQKHPSLNTFVKKAGELAEYHAKLVVDAQRNGHIYLNYYKIKANYGDELFSEKLFMDTMLERPEIESIDFAADGYEIEIAKDYIQTESDLKELDEQDIKVICAKHILYQNEAGGEKANFSNCLLNGLDLANRELDGANFNNAVLVNVDMENCSLCCATFNGAKFYNCNMVNIIAEESEFKNAKIIYSDMNKSLFTHSNFTGAQLIGCDVMGVDMNQSCIGNTRFDDTDIDEIDMKGTSTNEEKWKVEQSKNYEQVVGE